MLCPRKCAADRLAGRLGFCGEGPNPRLAVATLHRGEEPPLCGSGGSGAVFFSGCTLKCSFCQNHGISRGGIGREVDVPELAGIFAALQRAGAENLNLVTGTHFLPAIIEALKRARAQGMSLPVLWNSSGYENEIGLNLIKTFTDVHLPDLKTLDTDLAARLFRAPDYPAAATAAILRMAAAGKPDFDANGMLVKGTIVRHLVLPGYLESTRRVLAWFAENLSGRALLSVMFQYLPLPGAAARRASDRPDDGGAAAGSRDGAAGVITPPGRTIEDTEYYSVIGMLEDLGIDDGFIQEPEHESIWLPDFERENPFPDDYSKVVWHWKHGFVGESASG